MFCTKCASSIDRETLFCPYCGNDSFSETLPKRNNIRPLSEKKINPHLYTFSLWGGGVVAGAGWVWGDSSTLLGLSLCIIGGAAVAFACLYSLIILHRCWAILEDYNPRTTPNKAVWFQFIPIFNLYWMFVAYWGLAKDANEFSRQAGSEKRISENLALATMILFLIPYVNFIGLVLFNILLYKMADFNNSPFDNDKLSSVDLRHDPRKQRKVAAAAGFCALLFVAGIVAAIYIPQFAALKGRLGRTDTLRAECEMIIKAEESYHSVHGRYLQTLHPESDLKKYGITKLSNSAFVMSDGSFYMVYVKSPKTNRKVRYNSLEEKMQVE